MSYNPNRLITVPGGMQEVIVTSNKIIDSMFSNTWCFKIDCIDFNNDEVNYRIAFEEFDDVRRVIYFLNEVLAFNKEFKTEESIDIEKYTTFINEKGELHITGWKLYSGMLNHDSNIWADSTMKLFLNEWTLTYFDDDGIELRTEFIDVKG
jgi:hypothetical protein